MNEIIQKAKDLCKLIIELDNLIYFQRDDLLFNFSTHNYILFNDIRNKWDGYKFRCGYGFSTDNAIQIMDDNVTIFFHPESTNMNYIDYDDESCRADQYDIPIPVFHELTEEETFFQNSLVQEYKEQELYIIMAYLKQYCNISFSLDLNYVPHMMNLLRIKNVR